MRTLPEFQMVIYPLPYDVSPCTKCYGILWEDERCTRCEDVGYLFLHDDENYCECLSCNDSQSRYVGMPSWPPESDR